MVHASAANGASQHPKLCYLDLLAPHIVVLSDPEYEDSTHVYDTVPK
jgi:hypothetical protein